ncbi:hypothetical protein IQ07DRAFT_599372 [Pyrenochaeta sp. DS3sAY3a]|nr:hypothetical protein IQ07DRAFT_599372 [Pyrenochaeta sp. DS3sAY3a]
MVLGFTRIMKGSVSETKGGSKWEVKVKVSAKQLSDPSESSKRISKPFRLCYPDLDLSSTSTYPRPQPILDLNLSSTSTIPYLNDTPTSATPRPQLYLDLNQISYRDEKSAARRPHIIYADLNQQLSYNWQDDMRSCREDMADLVIDSPDSRPFRFMDLPTELRFMVYEHLTKQIICPLTVPDRGVAVQATVMDPNCTRVSRQFRKEADAAIPPVFSKGKTIVYLARYDGPNSQHILNAIDIARGYDNYLLPKHQASSENACLAPPVPQLAITAGLTAFGKLDLFSQWGVDVAKSKRFIRDFLQQSVLKLRQNPQVLFEFRVLIAKDLTSAELNNVIWYRLDNRSPKPELCITTVYQDEETQAAAHGNLVEGPQELATPEEVAYMKRCRY